MRPVVAIDAGRPGDGGREAGSLPRRLGRLGQSAQPAKFSGAKKAQPAYHPPAGGRRGRKRLPPRHERAPLPASGPVAGRQPPRRREDLPAAAPSADSCATASPPT